MNRPKSTRSVLNELEKLLEALCCARSKNWRSEPEAKGVLYWLSMLMGQAYALEAEREQLQKGELWLLGLSIRDCLWSYARDIPYPYDNESLKQIEFVLYLELRYFEPFLVDKVPLERRQVLSRRRNEEHLFQMLESGLLCEAELVQARFSGVVRFFGTASTATIDRVRAKGLELLGELICARENELVTRSRNDELNLAIPYRLDPGERIKNLTHLIELLQTAQDRKLKAETFVPEAVQEFLSTNQDIGDIAHLGSFQDLLCQTAAVGRLVRGHVVSNFIRQLLEKQESAGASLRNETWAGLRRLAYSRMIAASHTSPSLYLDYELAKNELADASTEQPVQVLECSQQSGVLLTAGPGILQWPSVAYLEALAGEQIAAEFEAGCVPQLSFWAPWWRSALHAAAYRLGGLGKESARLIRCIRETEEEVGLRDLVAASCLSLMTPVQADDLRKEYALIEDGLAKLCVERDCGPITRQVIDCLLGRLRSDRESDIVGDASSSAATEGKCADNMQLIGSVDDEKAGYLSVDETARLLRQLHSDSAPEGRLDVAIQLRDAILPETDGPNWTQFVDLLELEPRLEKPHWLRSYWTKGSVRPGVRALAILWHEEQDWRVQFALTQALAKRQYITDLLAFRPLPRSPLRELALQFGFFVFKEREEYALCLRDGAWVHINAEGNQEIADQLNSLETVEDIPGVLRGERRSHSRLERGNQ